MNKTFIVTSVLLMILLAVFAFTYKDSRILTEQTLALIKPDAVSMNQSGQIIAKIEQTGLRIIAMKMTQMTPCEAEQFYAVHKNRPFFKNLIKFMSSGPIVALVLEGDQAVTAYRSLMGATDPQKANEDTLRRLFGTSIDRNAVHGSDSLDNAKKEISFFFTQKEISPR
jgi:nucleoside-diphosphate kinase